MTGRRVKVLVLVTILVGACTRTQPAVVHSPTPSSAPSKIAWSACGGGFQCGSLQVPLDYSTPEGRKISLALIRRPATNPAAKIGSLLLNPGGPGESGIGYLRGDIQTYSNLNRRFDVMSWDPRGVGASTPVKCEDSTQLDVYVALDSVLDDPAEKQATIDADKSFAAACQQRSGDLLPFMDSASTARDLDEIRDAVGDEKLTYLGYSYGTFIGQWYAHLFPDHVRALSLDGVVDPTVPANQSLLGQVKGFEQNWQAYLAGRPADRATRLAADMARLDVQPLRVGDRLLTRSLAMTGVLLTLYSQQFWTYLDAAIAALEHGDGTVLLSLADEYIHRKDATYDNFIAINWATYCLDFAVPADVAAYDRLGPAFAAASPLFGPWTQYSNLQCAYWPVKPKHSNEVLTVTGAAPILLVGGTNDPATPYSEAQSVNRQISGSVLLTREGNGHTSYDASPCAHAAEDAYLMNLTLPAAGTVCSS